MQEKTSYKESLNLPQTSFAMEAKLVANEPIRLEKWKKMDLYRLLLAARKGSPRWVLHDGPPFANGDIHIGHVINKTLKDVIVRFRTMQGHESPYVPGWDCHGLPIEHKIQQDLGPKLRQMSTLDVRKLCFAYAEKYAAIQSVQFQRLGILGDWENPYLTMRPAYEAQTLEVFARFVEAGLVYKQLKPVHWSISNQTALADAELEYQDVTDNSVYVEFRAADAGAKFLGDAAAHFLIWTTTPWTLPANMAVAVHPEVRYALVEYSKDGKPRVGVVAEELVQRVFANRPGVGGAVVKKTFSGAELVAAGADYHHPLVPDKKCPLLEALYVTTTDGTGLVHTAPGHGEEDYAICVANHIEIYCPVLPNGRYDDSVPAWLRGQLVWEANPVITQRLRDEGTLLAEEKITHSYPHDWRSKKPTIFRATEQWFIKMDQAYAPAGGAKTTLREAAQNAAEKLIDFVPKWGQARLLGMLQSRPDWCISRQRAWGLPIPVFYNEKNEPLLTPASVRAVAKRFGEKGSDAWFTDSPAELLGDFDPGPEFPKDKLRKEKDIFDVWFESGSSWQAVLRGRPDLKFPTDLYLEGSDQHRGWFQLSLLNSLGAAGQPPFKQVLTHGFIVKPDGTKVSKSDPEYVTATQEINRHGADLLRLWCCSMDYQGDIPTSPQVIQKFGDKYRKIRNTLRFLLSNLYDFTPSAADAEVPPRSLDAWALAELDALIVEVTAAYDSYQLHAVFRMLHEFCAVQLSAIYGNASKDRLYCEPPASALRRRCQAVMHKIVVALTKMLAPMLVFTADEVWEHIPHKENLASIHLALFPQKAQTSVADDCHADWTQLMSLRNDLQGQLDVLTRQIGKYKALDAEVVYEVSDAQMQSRLEAFGVDLEDMVSAGHHRFMPGGGSAALAAKLVDRRNEYGACARCWKRRPDVGSNAAYADLCRRCADAMTGA